MVRSGEVLKTVITQDEAMIAEAKALVRKFHQVGPITVQLIRQTGTNVDYFIEINPRFGGGMPLSMLAGEDSAQAILRLLEGEELVCQPEAAEDGSIFSRFDQCIQIREQAAKLLHVQNWDQLSALVEQLVSEKRLSAVVFDLDDTLYPEKAYIRCGVKEAAKCTQVRDAEKKLWDAFEKGASAIDAVFEEEGIWSGERKTACLEAYR